MEQAPQPQDGMELNVDMLIQTQNNFISQAAVKQVQMETAINQLMGENAALREQLSVYDDGNQTEAKVEEG